jgi:hypothetical protein
MSENTKNGVSPESPQGFYASALHGEMLIKYQRALKMEGLAEEIALLRAYIKMILIRSTTAGMNYFLKAITCLDHLCKTNKKVFFDKYAEAQRLSDETRLELWDYINSPREDIHGPVTT